MQLLFDHKYKRLSGWIFYLTIPIAVYAFVTRKFQDLLIFKVFPLFSFEMQITTEHSENVIGSEGFRWIENGLVNEILITVIIISGIVNSFAREKFEDELIGKLRSDSLILSLYLNYGFILIANLLIYELTFIYVLVFNLGTILLFFNLIFKYKLHQHYNI